MKMRRRGGREKVFARRDDDETVVMQRARGRGSLALMSSTRGNKCKEFINRGFSAISNIRRGAVLKTRPKELTRFNVVGQHLMLEMMPG